MRGKIAWKVRETKPFFKKKFLGFHGVNKNDSALGPKKNMPSLVS